MANASRGLASLAVGLPVAAGLAVAWHWRGDPLLLGCYLAAWTAFTLYSVPPFRLKVRGLAGLVADAAGRSPLPDPGGGPPRLSGLGRGPGSALACRRGAMGLRLRPSRHPVASAPRCRRGPGRRRAHLRPAGAPRAGAGARPLRRLAGGARRFDFPALEVGRGGADRRACGSTPFSSASAYGSSGCRQSSSSRGRAICCC